MGKTGKGNTIILASASPRRRELLCRAGVDFEVVASKVSEISGADLSPDRLVRENALLKAEDVAQSLPCRIVLGADTVVFCSGRVLGKPADIAEARAMLSFLSGRTHTVYTGVALVEQIGRYACGRTLRRLVDAAESSVTFKNLTSADIDYYLSKVDVLDKAGAYAVQEFGDFIISRIDGGLDNVMGLPCGLVMDMLKAFEAERKSVQLR